METLLNLIAVVLVMAGFFGIILPAVPDLPLMLGGLLVRSLATDFAHPTVTELIVAAAASGVVMLLEAFAAPLVARRFGASKFGQWGALIGSVCSLFLVPVSPWFILILPIVGTVIGELMAGRTRREAIKSSIGTALGVSALLVTKVVVALGLLGTLIVSFWRT